MIFVVKSDKKIYAERALHDQLYRDLNQDGKNQIVVLPEGCTYDVIYDEPVKDVKIVDKESARGII